LILSVCIRPSISVQATRPLSILKNLTRSSCFLGYTEILTFFHYSPFGSAVLTYVSLPTILRIKPHFMYHDNLNQELNSKVIFGLSTLNGRGINYFGYGYILCVDQCYHHNQARSVVIKDLLLGCVAGPLSNSVIDILLECGSNVVSLYLIIFYTI